MVWGGEVDGRQDACGTWGGKAEDGETWGARGGVGVTNMLSGIGRGAPGWERFHAPLSIAHREMRNAKCGMRKRGSDKFWLGVDKKSESVGGVS
jgi:hypothetical protein